MSRIPFLFIPLMAAATGFAANYDISWYTIDGGGAVSAGGGYTLSSSIGQPDAGVLTGGNYTLYGGFQVPAGTVAPACDGDLNHDGQVNAADLLLLYSAFEVNGGADINHDGQLNQADLFDFATYWESSCAQ